MMRALLFSGVVFGGSLAIGYAVGEADGRTGRGHEPREIGVNGNFQVSSAQPVALRNATQASQDLIGAMMSATQDVDYLRGRRGLNELIQAVPSAEMPALLESAQRLALRFRQPVILALLERWLHVDAGSATAWIQSHPKLPYCTLAWVEANPREALAAVLTKEPDNAYWDATRAAVRKLAGQDPAAVVALLSSYPASRMRDAVLGQEIAKYAKTNPAEALRYASPQLSGKQRDALIQSTLISWAADDPQRAIDNVSSAVEPAMPDLFGNAFLSEFTRSLAKADPVAALGFAAGLPEDVRKYPLIGAAAVWAAKEPLEALNWALENEIDVLEQFKTTGGGFGDSVLGAALKTQPDATIEWVLQLPGGSERERLVRDSMRAVIFTRRPGDVSLEAGSTTFQLFNSLSLSAQADVADDFGNLMARKGALPSDPQWARSFPDSGVRDRVVAGALGQIYTETPSKAEELLARISSGSGRDLALKAVASAQSTATPDLAVQRSLEIRDGELRRDSLDETVPEWLKHDEAACRAWIESQGTFPPAWVAEWVAEAKGQ